MCECEYERVRVFSKRKDEVITTHDRSELGAHDVLRELCFLYMLPSANKGEKNHWYDVVVFDSKLTLRAKDMIRLFVLRKITETMSYCIINVSFKTMKQRFTYC